MQLTIRFLGCEVLHITTDPEHAVEPGMVASQVERAEQSDFGFTTVHRTVDHSRKE